MSRGKSWGEGPWDKASSGPENEAAEYGAVTTLDPRTTLDPGARRVRRRPRYGRVQLPLALERQFIIERELAAGGEANVLLVNDRTTGAQRVVRLYRREDLPIDEGKLSQLRAADRQYLIGLLEYGSGDGHAWEVLEYAQFGSLLDLMNSRPGPLSEPEVLAIFDQLTAAITYLNSIGMVHRDIKPANVLVRSRQPLDLVLADFGLTNFLAGARQPGTRSRTVAYAPPEALFGQAASSVDWWSLGITVFELLTGRHPFQRPDGTWQDDAMIVRGLTISDIDLSAVTDARWRQLLRGLLTRVPELRWGSAEVTRWRRGESPPVRERPFAGATLASDGESTASVEVDGGVPRQTSVVRSAEIGDLFESSDQPGRRNGRTGARSFWAGLTMTFSFGQPTRRLPDTAAEMLSQAIHDVAVASRSVEGDVR